MKLGANAAIIGRTLSRLESTSKELGEQTGKECLPVQADVRKYSDLEAAVAKTVERFGKIDFVICGEFGNWNPRISPSSVCPCCGDSPYRV
jgi:peroxisomal 2,4-dienoyl-CoA reductase